MRSSAAIRTWDRLKAETDRLPQHATLTMDLLMAVASRTTAGSRTRLDSCKVLKRRNPGWKLYDFRHCWAVRSIRESVPTGLASWCMGHDIAVHKRTYHRWLTESEVAALVASRQ